MLATIKCLILLAVFIFMLIGQLKVIVKHFSIKETWSATTVISIMELIRYLRSVSYVPRVIRACNAPIVWRTSAGFAIMIMNLIIWACAKRRVLRKKTVLLVSTGGPIWFVGTTARVFIF